MSNGSPLAIADIMRRFEELNAKLVQVHDWLSDVTDRDTERRKAHKAMLVEYEDILKCLKMKVEIGGWE